MIAPYGSSANLQDLFLDNFLLFWSNTFSNSYISYWYVLCFKKVVSLRKYQRYWWTSQYIVGIYSFWVGWMMHTCVSDDWFRFCPIAWLPPTNHLNQCWLIVYWAIGDKFQWNIHWNKNIILPNAIPLSHDLTPYIRCGVVRTRPIFAQMLTLNT